MNEWYIVFAENITAHRWWQKPFMWGHPPNFGHITLYQCITDRHVVCIDPGPARLKIQVRELEVPVKQRMAEMAEHYPVLHYIAPPEDEMNWTFYVPSCVSVAKYILGINSRALTPLGLFKDLLERKAETVSAF